MKNVYANRFLVRPPAQNPPLNLFLAVQHEVNAWAIGRVFDREGIEIEIPLPGKQEITPRGTIVRAEGSGIPEKVAIWRLTYDHPDDNDPARRWKTTVSLAVLGDIVEVSVNIAAGRPGRRIDPDLPAFIGRPNIVKDLFAKFPCGVEGLPLTSRYVAVSEGEVEAFVNDQLLDPDRTLPIVVVSPTVFGLYAIDTGRVASALAGLALTIRLDDVDSTYQLSDILGARLSVFDGGVRIYWPEMTLSDNRYRHDLFLKSHLELFRPAERVQNVTRPIMAFAAATAIEDAPFYQRARQGLLQLHRQSVEADGKLARDALAASKLLKARGHQGVSEAVEALLAELDAKAELVKVYEDTIEAMHQEIKTLQRVPYQLDKERASIVEPTAQHIVEPSTILEATELSSGRFKVLNIWPSAYDAAAKSLSNRAVRIAETLQIIAEVGDEYFAAKRAGKGLGASFDAVFRRNGAPQYKPQDSETTTSMFKAEHTFSNGSKSIHFKKHFTLRGKPADCVQVYFEFDDESERVDIGYIGKHLPFSGDTS